MQVNICLSLLNASRDVSERMIHIVQVKHGECCFHMHMYILDRDRWLRLLAWGTLGKRFVSDAVGCPPSCKHVRRSCTMLLLSEAPWQGDEEAIPISPYLHRMPCAEFQDLPGPACRCLCQQSARQRFPERFSWRAPQLDALRICSAAVCSSGQTEQGA